MIVFREYRPGDRGILFDSYIRQMLTDIKRLEGPFKTRDARLSFVKAKEAELERFIEKNQVTAIADDEDIDHVLGYIIFKKIDDAVIVHYAYLKTPYQGLGLFRKAFREFLSVDKESPAFYTYKSPWKRYAALVDNYKLVYRPEFKGV